MLPKSFQELIDYFAELPGVGPKMAERLVLHLFKEEKEKLENFSDAIKKFKQNLSFCPRCFNIAEDGLCAVCKNKNRDQTAICVVEDPLDAISIERTQNYKGLYHILGGNLSVMTPEEISKLKINELMERIKKEPIKEVIIATNPTTDGDTTALYLARHLKPQNIKISKLGRGMPTGGDIEYADDITLSSALEGRKEV